MRSRILLPLAAAFTLAAPAVASADFAHVVAPGESLYSIAAADGLSVAQVAAANGLSPGAQLVTGDTVQIPPAGAAAPASTASMASPASGDGDADSDDGYGSAATAASTSTGSSTSSSATGGYTVQPGDTLSAIAAQAGISVASLAAANGLDPNAPLLSGSVISLTGAGAAGGAPSSAAAAAGQPIGAAAQGSPNGGPYPTAETVTASEVGSIASANGVSPSLAAAIGWQESGFNNDLVSSANAVGVMQILPGTWDWIQRSLTAGTPLAPASAADNVRGGVLMLHSLLGATGGDPALAAAGYYQGLASVRQNGMYSDTQSYVNNVLALRSRFGGP